MLQYFPDGEAMILAAANDGGPSHPGWYFNLMADPAARVEVMGRTVLVHADELPAGEAAAWWERILRRAPKLREVHARDASRHPHRPPRPVPRIGLIGPGTATTTTADGPNSPGRHPAGACRRA